MVRAAAFYIGVAAVGLVAVGLVAVAIGLGSVLLPRDPESVSGWAEIAGGALACVAGIIRAVRILRERTARLASEEQASESSATAARAEPTGPIDF